MKPAIFCPECLRKGINAIPGCLGECKLCYARPSNDGLRLITPGDSEDPATMVDKLDLGVPELECGSAILDKQQTVCDDNNVMFALQSQH